MIEHTKINITDSIGKTVSHYETSTTTRTAHAYTKGGESNHPFKSEPSDVRVFFTDHTYIQFSDL